MIREVIQNSNEGILERVLVTLDNDDNDDYDDYDDHDDGDDDGDDDVDDDGDDDGYDNGDDTWYKILVTLNIGGTPQVLTQVQSRLNPFNASTIIIIAMMIIRRMMV